MRPLLIALVLLAARSAPAPAGDPEIIVEGHQLSRRDIASAVRSISNPQSTGGFESQYPRWADRICIMVAGFPRDGGQFIADRIGAVARELKLDAGQPGCLPNVFIIATDDPPKLIAGLRLKRQSLVSGQDVPVLRRIQQSHDAVRWIGASTFTGSAGEATQQSDFGMSGESTPQTSSYGGGSRIVARTQTRLTRETIVIDSRQIGGINYGQLADYLAFVTLAQLNPHAEAPGVDTILSLFPRGGAAPAGLTDFDRAYLKGLYGSSASDVGAIQRSQIEGTINQDLRPTKNSTDAGKRDH